MQPDFNKTKIIATIGPSSSSIEQLKSMFENGMNLARLNFSHGSYEDHKKVIDNVRKLNESPGVHIGLLADLQGPKIRLGDVKPGVVIHTGDQITFTTEECLGDEKRVYITYPQFPKDVKAGETIMVNDGKLILSITKTDGDKEVIATVEHGGPLESKKGVNLPNTKISLPCLTPKDLRDLDFALEHKIEWVGLSFVRTAQDVKELKSIITSKGGKSKVIAKVEKPEAVRELVGIIQESDAIMVARGDLGVGKINAFF
ncbi:pyruvate kinase, partial [Bacteroidota bacterium]